MPNINVPASTTITFDEHITKVSWLGWTSQGDTQIYEATTSGQNIDWFYPDDGNYYVITFTITLDKNYILNDVNVNSISGGVPIKDKTNNTFQINLRDDSGTYDPSTITLTSKLEGVSDTKPVYKFINNTWVKQDAFQFTNGSWVRISTAITALATPSISLSGDTLTIGNVANATSYAIYSNNTLLTTITTTSVDLSTLITTAGTYTIYAIAKATGYADSEKSNEVSYIKIDNWKCTVANLGSANPTSVTFTHEGTMPTFEEITFNSDIFIKIPTMYRKVNTVVDNQITSYTISNNKTDDEYKPYPCFLKEDGITIMPYILIGKYFSSSSTTCNSIQTYATSNYSENGRANAVAKGEGYQLYDWMMHKLWQDLITCKMNNININSGTGIDIDSLGLYWSSYEAYIDGISHFPNFVAFSYKPTAYIDNPRWNSPNYNSDIYAIATNSGVIKNLGYNSDHPFVNYPTSVEKSSENIYYCDVYTSSTDTSPIISTIGGKSKNYGAFFVNAASGWRVKHYIRLCYRPINE